MLEVSGLSYQIKSKKIIEDISLGVEKSKFVGIVGPNGSGKSTLLKNIYKELVGTGDINLGGRDIFLLSEKELALEMAVVGQHNNMEFNLCVEEIVLMGRYPHKRILSPYTGSDRKKVVEALEDVGMLGYEKREFNSLSGGERQRVLIARAIAQEARIVVLDEPTNHLDIYYQLQIMKILKELGVTVVSAIHDMNIASMYCDKVVAIKDGKIYAEGTPEDIFTVDFFRQIFSVDVDITRNSTRVVIEYNPI